MTKSFLTFTLLWLFLLQVNAQSLYMPRDVQKAYQNKTRSMDGKPGKNYWQNHGRYNIAITVMPPNRMVRGVEQVIYFNNSPDTIKMINMKLIMNIHRAGATRFRSTGTDYITPGMQIDSIFVGGSKKQWNNDEARTTNQYVHLTTPLMPHDSVKLNITWHYELATGEGREGVIDSTSFFLGYFYPRVAVYDDYNHWDLLEFNDRQEFYNDFNDYTLSVTVPKNFIVWATGTLQNPNDVLQSVYADRLKQSMNTDSVIHVVTPGDLVKNSVTAQNERNTWIWKAAHITDMAVGLSNHYNWDAASTVVDDAMQRRAGMQAAYNDRSADFHQAVKFGLYSLNWFSRNLPGVPYPFPKMTAFEGFGTMEFPMMVNDTHETDIADAQSLQDHEMVHTYFPFYMGINETRFGFMDEGWATTFEYLINGPEIGKKPAEDIYKNTRVSAWIHDASGSEDLPTITPTSELKDGYAHNAYGKASLSYLALKDLLGEAQFKKALHNYMANWTGKHPIPWDYFNSINTGSGKNLNWFFQNWFFSNYYDDLAIQTVAHQSTGYRIVINNIGGFAIPFDLKITYSDGAKATIHQTPAIWYSNQKQATIALKNKKYIKSIVIDNGVFMDADESNNTWTTR